ncbi:hypothetical protein KQI77_02465 [Clostridium sp. MSJ-8]|uniref:hypothetical protein n=1 Tax=Clostridium sp. MSJ-8 TaxID=2841510 RepID=UPI001C0EF84F|nr:hypothetical protein [Clostridium sp. MSJ-8]MBU5487025.1 hypothetical protein [Clostridium sp. MSJ-8]
MGYQFGDNDIKLDIAGEKFTVVYGASLLNRVKDLGEQNAELKSDSNNVEKTIILLEKAIDTICGEGAVKKIFKDREINYYDLVDIVEYISKEISDFQVQKNKKYSLNRVVR